MSTTCPVAKAGDDFASRMAALRHPAWTATCSPPATTGSTTPLGRGDRTTAHHPAVIVVADNVGDVIATVSFAADLGVGLGVQATREGGVVPVDGVLLVTARCRTSASTRRSARPGSPPGARGEQVIAAASGPRPRPRRRVVPRGWVRSPRRSAAGSAGSPGGFGPGVRHRALVRGRDPRTARGGAHLPLREPAICSGPCVAGAVLRSA